MGLIGGLFRLVGFLVLVVIGLGAYLYFVDYTVEATITEKGGGPDNPYILVTPELLPVYSVRQDLEPEAGQYVCEGYSVNYRIQSGYTEVMDRQGNVVYDSENGLRDALGPLLRPC